MAGFVEIATEDRARAEALLLETPALASASPWHALVLGELDAVERAIVGGTLDVRAPGGPLMWTPLVYVCFSRFAGRDSPRAAALVATARRLLALGSDPNAWFETPAFPGNPLPCLYGATGYNDNPALGRLLVEAGARIDDNESIYHSTEHEDLECLRMLLSFGGTVTYGNVLKHMLDREAIDGVRLLLDSGADPNATNGRGETALHWAVTRGRSAAILDLLIARGAALDARRDDGRSAYAMAVLFGNTEAQSVLQQAGADTTLSALDRYLEVAGTADETTLAGLLAVPPALPAAETHLLPDLASVHRTGMVRGLLAAGVDVNTPGELGATALHWACWKGHADLVGILLTAGADTTIEDPQFHAKPGGWLQHGSQFCGEPGGDYAGALRAMLDAGAFVPAFEAPTGRADLDAVLRERGLLQ